MSKSWRDGEVSMSTNGELDWSIRLTDAMVSPGSPIHLARMADQALQHHAPAHCSLSQVRRAVIQQWYDEAALLLVDMLAALHPKDRRALLQEMIDTLDVEEVLET